MITRRKLLANGAVIATAAGMKLPAWACRLDVSGTDKAAIVAVVPATGQIEHALLIGVDCYPPQTPGDLWEEDARMSAGAGLTNGRVAEFAWSRMETAE